MDKAVLDEFLRDFLNEIEAPFQHREDVDAYAVTHPSGQLLNFRILEGPELSEGQGHEVFIKIATVILTDVTVDDPIEWKRLALANSETAFVRFSVNEADQLAVDMDVFAEGLSFPTLARAMQAVATMAVAHGDLAAEWFGGHRAIRRVDG